jgi:GTPase SAR1 family protein
MDTFLHLKTWLREIQNEASSNALVFLIANKKDKEADREVEYAKGE